MSGHTFFFNKKMAYSSSVSAFMANALNSIMKSAVFFFPYLKDSIFHSVSAAFVLSLNVVLISLMKSFQSWIPSFSSSSSRCVYAHYISSKASQDCYDSVVGLHNSVALEEQLYSSPPVFKFRLVTIKLS